MWFWASLEEVKLKVPSTTLSRPIPGSISYLNGEPQYLVFAQLPVWRMSRHESAQMHEGAIHVLLPPPLATICEHPPHYFLDGRSVRRQLPVIGSGIFARPEIQRRRGVVERTRRCASAILPTLARVTVLGVRCCLLQQVAVFVAVFAFLSPAPKRALSVVSFGGGVGRQTGVSVTALVVCV